MSRRYRKFGPSGLSNRTFSQRRDFSSGRGRAPFSRPLSLSSPFMNKGLRGGLFNKSLQQTNFQGGPLFGSMPIMQPAAPSRHTMMLNELKNLAAPRPSDLLNELKNLAAAMSVENVTSSLIQNQKNRMPPPTKQFMDSRRFSPKPQAKKFQREERPSNIKRSTFTSNTRKPGIGKASTATLKTQSRSTSAHKDTTGTTYPKFQARKDESFTKNSVQKVSRPAHSSPSKQSLPVKRSAPPSNEHKVVKKPLMDISIDAPYKSPSHKSGHQSEEEREKGRFHSLAQSSRFQTSKEKPEVKSRDFRGMQGQHLDKTTDKETKVSVTKNKNAWPKDDQCEQRARKFGEMCKIEEEKKRSNEQITTKTTKVEQDKNFQQKIYMQNKLNSQHISKSENENKSQPKNKLINRSDLDHQRERESVQQWSHHENRKQESNLQLPSNIRQLSPKMAGNNESSRKSTERIDWRRIHEEEPSKKYNEGGDQRNNSYRRAQPNHSEQKNLQKSAMNNGSHWPQSGSSKSGKESLGDRGQPYLPNKVMESKNFDKQPPANKGRYPEKDLAPVRQDDPNVQCQRCKKTGHLIQYCNSTRPIIAQRTPNSMVSDIVCTRCQRTGHMTRFCPAKNPVLNSCRKCKSLLHLEKNCMAEKRKLSEEHPSARKISQQPGQQSQHPTGDYMQERNMYLVCQLCDMSGHIAKDCPSIVPQPPTRDTFEVNEYGEDEYEEQEPPVSNDDVYAAIGDNILGTLAHETRKYLYTGVAKILEQAANIGPEDHNFATVNKGAGMPPQVQPSSGRQVKIVQNSLMPPHAATRPQQQIATVISPCYRCGQTTQGKGHTCPARPPDSYKCVKCQLPGHFVENCPRVQPNVVARNVCVQCDMPGHLSKDCPYSYEEVLYCSVCDQPGHTDQECPETFKMARMASSHVPSHQVNIGQKQHEKMYINPAMLEKAIPQLQTFDLHPPEHLRSQSVRVSHSSQSVRDDRQSTQSVRHVQQSTQSVRHIQQSTQSVRHVPQSTQSVRHAPQSIQSVRHTPQSIQSVRHTPQSIQSVRHVPQSSQSVRHVPQSTQSLRHVPQSTQSLRHIPQSSALKRSGVTCMKCGMSGHYSQFCPRKAL